MITELSVKNYKSLYELKLELGRITVLIGANGAGKSNILEALALASAAANDKLDNEFLATRGIRVTDDPRHMRSGFETRFATENIHISLGTDKVLPIHYELRHDSDTPYSSWENIEQKAITYQNANAISKIMEKIVETLPKEPEDTSVAEINGELTSVLARTFLDEFRLFDKVWRNHINPSNIKRFLIYSPEYSTLRTFEEEGQIQPLGIRGEGLLKLLKVLSDKHPTVLSELKQRMECIDWFSDFEVPSNLSSGERTLRVRDRYLDEGLEFFNQRSVNEGFLFLLFYFCLFLSDDTPPFFAVDNIDASLNPKLGRELVTELAKLAKEKNKQAIFTTHNPAILDGLDLHDDEQRLFVVKRNRKGHTKVERIMPPRLEEGQTPVRLSEAFLRGYIGGLPKNF